MNYVVFVLAGLILAGIEALLFISFKKKIIVGCIGLFGGLGVILKSWEYIYNILQITEPKPETFACYLISYFLGFIIFLYSFFVLFIKNSEDKHPLRMVDILLGNAKSLEYYIENRQKEIDMDLQYPKLLEMKNENEEKANKLDIDTMFLKEKESDLKKLKSKIQNEAKKNIFIELPIDFCYPVTNEFVNKFEHYLNRFLAFNSRIIEITDMFIEDDEKSQNIDRLTYLKSYFFSLCLITSTTLFGTGDEVRTHIRYLKNNYYVTLSCCMSGQESEEKLTNIPAKEGMIWASTKNKQSLIKSCNMDYHYPAANDHIWKDYLTIPITGIKKNQDWILSIGISIKSKDLHSDMLKFLNFVRIEDVFSKNICEFNKKHDIIKTVFEEV